MMNYLSRSANPQARSFSESLNGTFTFGTAAAIGVAGVGEVGLDCLSTIASRSLAISLNWSPRGRPPPLVPRFIRLRNDTRLPLRRTVGVAMPLLKAFFL
jgi:hypothetical protein